MATSPSDLPAPASMGYEVGADPHTGAVRLRIPVPLSPSRGGGGPGLALTYASGASNSAVGAGWSMDGLSGVTVDVREGAPRYDGSDPIAFGGTRVVPELEGGSPRSGVVDGHRVELFRARYGTGPLRYERWTEPATGVVHWRTRDGSGAVAVFGRSATHRVADPADPHRVFRWLLEGRYAPDGEAVRYEYAAEDGAGLDPTLAFEAPRIRRARFAQRYPKRIRYGNAAPLGPDSPPPPDDAWHLEAVFDYGDHDEAAPAPAPDRPWPVRADAFSQGRAGFEVRTYRLLRRVLQFHRFGPLGPDAVCVGATRLVHDEQPAGATVLRVDYEGRRTEAGGVASQTLPPLTMTYTAPAVGEAFEPVEPEAVTNVPAGLSGTYRWADLRGDGLPGILTETAGTWYYKPNLGGGAFGPQERVGEAPSLRGGPYALGDFDRDGNPNLGRLTGPDAGFFEYDREAGRWTGFQPFRSAPHVPADAPVQWVDLNADGLPDLVVPHPDHFVWYPSLGREGFGAPVTVPLPVAGESGPPWMVQSAALRFFFADMTGDGLPDLVRVDSGRVEYWPHHGLGRFGERVVMEGAPAFDHDGLFDPRRVRLTDLDGTGTADLVYLGRGEVRFWTNASGNRLTDERRRATPYIDDLAAVQVLDLLADGTPCLVWSSALPGDAEAPIRYLPLTSGEKPRLLVSVANAMGRETQIRYGSSAAHLLRDRAAGRDWPGGLPSHPTVVDEVEELDLIGGGRRTTRYAYHDGFFDGRERAFRGFGQVEQYDAEEHPGPGARPETYVAPTCIRTWFHDGTYGRDRLRAERFWSGDPERPSLPDPGIEAAGVMGSEEFEDAYRALAGLVLRQEVYATDEGVLAEHPLQVSQSTFAVRRLQPARADRPAAFHAYRTERLDHEYGGAPDDPRAAHHLTLSVGAYGEVLTEAHLTYPRRQTAPAGAEAQSALHAAATRTTFAAHDELDRYLAGVPVEAEEFEVLGLAVPAAGLAQRSGLLAALAPALAAPLDVHEPAGAGVQVRRREWERSVYWNDDRTAALAPGQVGMPVLLHHEEAACFTDALVQDVLGGRADAALLAAEGYALADGYWWQRDPTQHYHGADQFYRPHEHVTRRGGVTRFTFDASGFAHAAVEDALGQTIQTELDYQALAPHRTTDPNGTVAEVQYDALGVPIVRAMRGEALDEADAAQLYGDDLLAARAAAPAPTLAAILADPAAFVQGSGQYVFADPHAWQRDGLPPSSVALVREALRHDGTGGGTAGGPVQVTVSYFDGFGRPLQQKRRVGPGPAVQRDGAGAVVLGPDGAPALADAAERWLVSGHTVYGNKGQVVRQYEPFFSTTPAFESDEALQRYGVAAEHQYDALGQRVRTDLPNGTFLRTERTPWLERTYDANDTVGASAYRLAREALAPDDPERQALDGALAHADTPTTTHVDALGQEVLLVEALAGGVEHAVQQRHDAAGRLAEVVDERGIVALAYRHDMLGRVLYERSADAGERWTLPTAEGDAGHAWDGRGVHLATAYDLLGRPSTLRASGALGLDQIVQRWTYGEALPAAEAAARNAIGRLVEHRDGAGLLVAEAFAPSGALLRHARQLRAGYRAEPDWTDPAGEALDPDVHATRTRYDALGRVTRQQTPDGATRTLAYTPDGGLADVRLTTAGGELADHAVLQGATYNARGQRTQTALGNGVQLDVDYDADTFRMRRLRARRFGVQARTYQDLAYTYDPVGNVVRVADAAQQPAAPDPRVLQGLAVSADGVYTYDARYRLVRATGRVHQALLEHDYRRDLPHPDAAKGTRHITLNNGAAIERYTRTYAYDAAGNLSQVRHAGASQAWTTDYWVSPTSNRRHPALDPNGIPIANPEARFDAAGHCVRLPHLASLAWDSSGQLVRAVVVDRSGSGQPDDAEFYTYDGAGQRRRKVTEKLQDGMLEVTEKLYLDGCEIKRVRRADVPILERHTAHVGDGTNRVALVHRWTLDDRQRETDAPGVRVHYQLQNHLGSAALELDAAGDVITYEEYFPYGGSAFIAGDAARDVRLKDYRYSGKERDDETGLYYYGYRYYAPFIGGWLSPDPTGPADGPNLYAFVRGNPVTLTDPNGLQSTEATRGQVHHYAADALPPAYQQAFERLSPEMQAAWASGNLFLVHNGDGTIGTMSRAEAQAHVRERAAAGLDTNVGWVGGPEEEELDVTITEEVIDGVSVQTMDFHDGLMFTADDTSLGGPGDGGEGGGGAESGPDPDPGAPQPGTPGTPPGGGSGTPPGTPPGGGGSPQPGQQGRGTGLGTQGTGPGGGGTDPNGRGTGTQGAGTGAGSAGPGRGTAGTGSAPAGTPGGTRTTGPPGGRRGGNGDTGDGTGTGTTDGGGGGAVDPPVAPGGVDPNGSPEGIPEPPPNGYRPPPPGTQPGGTDPFGSPTGAPGSAGTGPAGAPGAGQGGDGQAGGESNDAPGTGPPPSRERDALDTLVDVASYVTLDAFFSDDDATGGSQDGIPGGMGLFDLNLGRWGQALYVGLAAVDVVLTVLTLGELKAAAVGMRAALRTGMSQLRRAAPLARRLVREAVEAVPRAVGKLRTAIRRYRAGLPLDDPLLDNNIMSWIASGRPEAVAFATRYRNLMSIDRTVAREFIRGGRSAHELWGLMQQHGIQLVRTASHAEADAIRLLRGGGQVVPDDFIVATARRLGIRFATGDRRAMRSAVLAGVDVRYFNFGPGSVVHRYGRAIRSLRGLQQQGVIASVRQFIGPLNPW